MRFGVGGGFSAEILANFGTMGTRGEGSGQDVSCVLRFVSPTHTARRVLGI
jgi:hypothetical protein